MLPSGEKELTYQKVYIKIGTEEDNLLHEGNKDKEKTAKLMI